MSVTLDDGLVLRTLRESPAGTDQKLAQFYSDAFQQNDDLSMNQLYNWTLDLASEAHPTTSPDDFWMVIDPTKEDMIVSAILLIPQMWRYEDIEIPIGRIELVATHSDYRRRGLIRKQMDAAHQRSAELGHLMQGITGIPHYYRRFGYAFTVSLGSAMGVNFRAIPALKPDEKPQYTLRPADEADIPALIQWDKAYADQCELSTVRTEQMWRYEFTHRNKNTPPALYTYIILDQEGDSLGYVAHHLHEAAGHASVVAFNVGERTSILATFNDVVRGLHDLLQQRFEGSDKMPERLSFDGGCHATIASLIQHSSSGVVTTMPYAWYLRVPDFPAFINRIKPVLERRLQGSGANNYTGELKISFFEFSGLVMRFEEGKLTAVEEQVVDDEQSNARFPYHSFLNVLFGHHDVDELRYILPEAGARRDAYVLLNILFPKKRSWLMALG